uniref:Calcium uniporter protein n=1 Tax=Physcomitrium patens TaxID=3218 RepID=A0A2K1JY44_PHYPA|nr:hypothetical protein PHYPA_013565 [Physcomitrium patens]
MAAVAEILSAQPDVQLPDVQIDFSGGSRSGENADPGNDTERCARNLEELNNGEYPELKTAYEYWQQIRREKSSSIDRLQSAKRAVRNELIQVIGFGLVFIGVTYTAASQASMLWCQNWYLSLLLLNLLLSLTLFAFYQKRRDFMRWTKRTFQIKSDTKVLHSSTECWDRYIVFVETMREPKDDLDSGILENASKSLLKEEIFVCLKLMCNNCHAATCTASAKA